MVAFVSSQEKNAIRRLWDINIIRFLKEYNNSKLLYFGLPSPEISDIKDWIDYIDEVIAFQCREYGFPSDPSQTRDAIIKLEKELLALERSKKISNFLVYDGYIEEVIAKGSDMSNHEFSQDKIITLYNLDFCNEITSPLEIINALGDVEKVYKFETIRKLLHFQSSLSRSSKFIIFLTINSNFFDHEMVNFSQTCDSQLFTTYLQRIAGLDAAEKRIRTLKAYVIYTLKTYFSSFNFVPHFLPTIFYSPDDADNSFLHFSILVNMSGSSPGILNTPQNISAYLNKKFITLNKEKSLCCKVTSGITEPNINLDVIKHFTDSVTYKKFWDSSGST